MPSMAGSRSTLWMLWAVIVALLATDALALASLLPVRADPWYEAEASVAQLVLGLLALVTGVGTFALRETLVLRDLRIGALDPNTADGLMRIRRALVALWSLSLARAAGQIGTGSPDPDSLLMAEYLERSVRQVEQTPQLLGFYDPGEGRWIRSILWHNPGWWDVEEPDWKYALHLEEGALEYERLTGLEDLDGEIHAFLQQLLARIQSDGTIAEFPDGYGTPAYEYGEALSVLGLAAITFANSDRWLAAQCLEGGQRIIEFVRAAFVPQSSEDNALLLAGLARLLKAGDALAAFAMDVREGPEPGLTDGGRLTLQIVPSVVTGPVSVRWSLPSAAAGVLRVFDVTGRQLKTVTLTEPALAGSVAWDARGDDGHGLPGGRYYMILDTPLGRQAQAFVLER